MNSNYVKIEGMAGCHKLAKTDEQVFAELRQKLKEFDEAEKQLTIDTLKVQHYLRYQEHVKTIEMENNVSKKLSEIYGQEAKIEEIPSYKEPSDEELQAMLDYYVKSKFQKEQSTPEAKKAFAQYESDLETRVNDVIRKLGLNDN